MLSEIRLGVLWIIQTLILICMVIINMSWISVQEITGHMAKSSPKYKLEIILNWKYMGG